MGFSGLGLALGLAVFAPNLLLLWFPPRPPMGDVRVPGVFVVLERAGQALCVTVPAITVGASVHWWWLIPVAVFVFAYWALWVRFLRAGRPLEALLGPVRGVPVPMALLPRPRVPRRRVVAREPLARDRRCRPRRWTHPHLGDRGQKSTAHVSAPSCVTAANGDRVHRCSGSQRRARGDGPTSGATVRGTPRAGRRSAVAVGRREPGHDSAPRAQGPGGTGNRRSGWGGPCRDRTDDIHGVNVALYQLS